jgi:pimeloyl-ACP methyl ester carboxylesterase
VAFAEAPDGTRIWYDVSGAGEPLLLLSGQSLDSRMWTGVREDLAREHRVVVVDHRGTGRSDSPDETPYTTALFARDAVAVLDAAGIERAHVYGFSMGGRVAQVLASDFPRRVGSLVLGASGPGGRHELARPQEASRALVRAASPAAREAVAELFFSPQWAARHPDVVQTVLPVTSRAAQRLHYAASTGHDGWQLLPRISAPTLVLHGADDRLTPADNAALLAGRIPGSRLEVLPGGRHGYLHELREVASPLVLDFLRSHPAA